MIFQEYCNYPLKMCDGLQILCVLIHLHRRNFENLTQSMSILFSKQKIGKEIWVYLALKPELKMVEENEGLIHSSSSIPVPHPQMEKNCPHGVIMIASGQSYKKEIQRICFLKGIPHDERYSNAKEQLIKLQDNEIITYVCHFNFYMLLGSCFETKKFPNPSHFAEDSL